MTDEEKPDQAQALIQFGSSLIMIVVFGAIVVACLWYMWEILQA
jgi:hypothetical protein